MTRTLRPPPTRFGRTRELRVGPVVMCVTVNRDERGNVVELFSKANGASGVQGHLDRVCTMASIALQGGAPLARIISHLRGDRTEPCGVAGQPGSIYDALGRVLEEEAQQ